MLPNYLCYVNSVLVYRAGGTNRLTGLMLAAGTLGLLLVGPGVIQYLPVMVVAALIFVLGIDLAKEALWDTIGRVSREEHITIVIIVVVMTYWDFVIGILAGIVFACLFFVLQASRRRNTIRAIFDGSIARSTVRRHITQRRFLEQVGTQTQILKLQGFLFFGTINSVEDLIRRALDIATWQSNPIRFLIVDFDLVSGLDFSAAEAFTRLQRLLEAKDVVLVFCGLQPDSNVGIALRSVDLWADNGVRLEVFANLNEALEWSENEYLRGMYSSGWASARAFGRATAGPGASGIEVPRTNFGASGSDLGPHKPPAGGGAVPGLGLEAAGVDIPDSKTRQPAFVLDSSFENSPRRSHLQQAARTALERAGGDGMMVGALNSVPELEVEDGASSADGDMVIESIERERPGERRTASSGEQLPPNALPQPTDGQQHQSQNQSTAVLQRRRKLLQPVPLLTLTFKPYAQEDVGQEFFANLAPYFTKVLISKGQKLWARGDEPDALYLIEKGILKARYDFPQEDFEINEAMLAGTIAGELSFLSGQVRNTSVHAELDCVLWKLDGAQMDQMQVERPAGDFRTFFRMLLRVTEEEHECLMSYLVTRLS
ncbi:unnamed protein product [Tilletia controversa]|uniref:Sulfate transporter family protein n=1 Tax=Tilletia controversa TaxID=13291 RepID=A0A8X7MUI1_9BASI|nr:hypothetical protein CF328_g5009 [Tilletia controversa]KAE8248777.1 hypothetical protein A4X06_0g3525 [Tilletia controversa]CAD6913165.1 unnamed protein product [Tilletia controversa]CAD6937899.1 unnamed protein product [Tilletia controversa]